MHILTLYDKAKSLRNRESVFPIQCKELDGSLLIGGRKNSFLPGLENTRGEEISHSSPRLKDIQYD